MDNDLRRRREIDRSFLRPSTSHKDIEAYYGPFALNAITQVDPKMLKCNLLKQLRLHKIECVEVSPWKF